jgi:hypothetical protein
MRVFVPISTMERLRRFCWMDVRLASAPKAITGLSIFRGTQNGKGLNLKGKGFPGCNLA